MKSVKIFILISVGFLLGAVVAAAVVWYYLVIAPVKEKVDQAEGVVEKVVNMIPGTGDVDESGVAESEPEVATGEAITIDITALPETQQKVLSGIGIDGPEYTITPGMQVCAENKLGADRLMEIVDGATPTFWESTSLVTCIGQ